MKRFFRVTLVLVLALILAVQTPLQALASGEEGPDYISEVKVFMGGSAEQELAAEGFTAITDENGKIVDVNQGAGGGWGSQGGKKVIIGYKTTKLQSEAITDLAVMNMAGGYKTQDYEALIDRYMGSQISPFIDNFMTAINEYRENIESDDDVNRQRAEYIRAALNKFTDDDCAGAGLGDLLLNETVYEMAKPEYDKLTEDEKKETGIVAVNARVRDAIPKGERAQHCDVLTVFAQADGQLMLLIYDLITRAADTGEDSWMDRFTALSYQDLLKSYRLPTTDAKKAAARDFEDDARQLLENWEKFRTQLVGAEGGEERLDAMAGPNLAAVEQKLDALDQNSGTEEVVDALSELAKADAAQSEMVDLAVNVTVADYLQGIEYGDGTMYDLFTRSSADLSKNLQELYPLIASLSDGQRAGLEFISLRELVMLSNRDVEYAAEDIEELEPISVFEGVDRAIYAPGGVALTSDALRDDALEREKNMADRDMFSLKTKVLWGVAGASLLGFIGSFSAYKILRSKLKAAEDSLTTAKSNADVAKFDFEMTADETYDVNNAVTKQQNLVDSLSAGSNTAAWMSAGFAVAMVILAGVSAYMTWSEMKAYYKVDFAVIPRYMVDEASITYYNARGEKLFRENHAAYYKAVTCNRPEDDKNFTALSDCADLNGDVGQQWVALYACRDNKVMPPILADSLKAVVGSTELPAGYSTGIHMFGSEGAFNMNNKLYVWEQSARSVFVYFKVDPEAPLRDPETTGSAFSGGLLALTGVGGLALGALVTGLSMTAYRKKKNGLAEA